MKQVKGVIYAQSSSSKSKSAISSKSSYYSTESSSNGAVGGGGVSKPLEVPKESFAKRYKYLWPLLTVNFAIGAYLFTRTKKKDVTIEEEKSNATPNPGPSVTENNVLMAQPARVITPIPEDQQRELFKWILEEKRKIKTNDPIEKKRIDEEKAILKQFIRAKSIPNL